MWGQSRARKRVTLGDVAVKLVVFEKGKRIHIEIKSFHLDGIRIVLGCQLAKQVDFRRLGIDH